ncbi:MAG: DNA polymerase III subunit gamma/tau [Acidaminobacteraceae bacterium]
MSYTALYRKFRPKVFEDVIGQKNLIETLKNQIMKDSIGHAYLLSGTRGTGKTSTAKLFSRAINCLNPDGVNPCNKCEVCLGILNESLMDIIEIDAASNNGVDDIREIRENVKYPPTKAKYKVYIIDEVHMLSQGAFNALLKTLEEPPQYVVFILATTEPHKIPDTIQSRCQRYDFKRVTPTDLISILKNICHELGIEYEDKALSVIVQKGEGAVRDCLSILDQCISFNKGILTYDLIVETLGLVDDMIFMNLTDYIVQEKTKEAMININEIISSGKNINQFLKDYIYYFRNLMLIKSSESLSDIIDSQQSTIEGLIRQAELYSLNNIIRILNILTVAETDMKWATNQRIHLEMTFMKIIELSFDDSKESLIERVKKLEALVDDIKSGAVVVTSPTLSASNNATTSPTNNSRPIQARRAAPQSKNSTQKSTAPVVEMDYTDAKDPEFNVLNENWESVLSLIKKRRISTHAFLIEGKPVYIKSGNLYIGFDDRFGFHMEAVSKPENKQEIERAIYQVLKYKLILKCDYLSNLGVNESKEEESARQEDDINGFFEGSLEKLDIKD